MDYAYLQKLHTKSAPDKGPSQTYFFVGIKKRKYTLKHRSR